MPCTNCRSVGRGPLGFAYVLLYDGPTAVRFRLRLCSTCWEETLLPLAESADVRTRDGVWWSRDVMGDLTPLSVSKLDAVPTTSADTLSPTTAGRVGKRRPSPRG
jgi:hypothetical protein